MAYVKTCPICKKQVSSRAEKCPHCGDISPQQKVQLNSQTNASHKNLNITINAGEVNNGIIEDQEPRFSRIEDPSLKDDFFCSTCKYYCGNTVWRFLIKLILAISIATALCMFLYFIPNIFDWWKIFSFLFKCIAVIIWLILLPQCLKMTIETSNDYCSNKHVATAVCNLNPARRINTNFKCKFWKNKYTTS